MRPYMTSQHFLICPYFREMIFTKGVQVKEISILQCNQRESFFFNLFFIFYNTQRIQRGINHLDL
jgi:hypothetical protein